MLFSEMEVQKRAHAHDRPPILSPPGFEDTAPPSAAKESMPAKPAAQPEVKP
jgi:hypothetical protein